MIFEFVSWGRQDTFHTEHWYKIRNQAFRLIENLPEKAVGVSEKEQMNPSALIHKKRVFTKNTRPGAIVLKGFSKLYNLSFDSEHTLTLKSNHEKLKFPKTNGTTRRLVL